MAFKAFYDGSGKSDRPSVTLTGVAASEELWAQFEPLWLNRLDRNKVIDRDFHMADLMSRNGNFKGWTISQRDALLIDLFSVFGEFWTKKMSAYSCTVFFAAHLEAKKMIASLRKPEAICVDYCVGGLKLTADQLASEQQPILLYFDRGERFMHTVNCVWEQFRKNRKGWPRQIKDIISADRSKYLPIQAADMLAWIINRGCQETSEHNEWQRQQNMHFNGTLGKHGNLGLAARLAVHHYTRCYADSAHIIARYPKG